MPFHTMGSSAGFRGGTCPDHGMPQPCHLCGEQVRRERHDATAALDALLEAITHDRVTPELCKLAAAVAAGPSAAALLVRQIVTDGAVDLDVAARAAWFRDAEPGRVAGLRAAAVACPTNDDVMRSAQCGDYTGAMLAVAALPAHELQSVVQAVEVESRELAGLARKWRREGQR